MAGASIKERDSVAVARPAEARSKRDELEGIVVEDFQLQINKLQEELAEARAAKKRLDSNAGTITTRGSEEELADKGAGRGRMFEIRELGEEIVRASKAAATSDEGSAALDEVREELLLVKRELATRTTEVEDLQQVTEEQRASLAGQLAEIETRWMSRFEEFNVDSSKNLKQLSTHFDGILKTVSDPNIEAATLQHRVKILTEQRLTAIKSLALNTTELAAEKASKEATLAHVRGQVSKFDLRITQLEKELGTAKGNNKKAEPHKTKIASLETSVADLRTHNSSLARDLALKTHDLEAFVAATAATAAHLTAVEPKVEATVAMAGVLAEINAELKDRIAVQEQMIEELGEQADLAMVEEASRDAAQEEELRVAREKLEEVTRRKEDLAEVVEEMVELRDEMRKKIERAEHEKEIAESKLRRAAESALSFPPTPTPQQSSSISAIPTGSTPAQLALLQHSDFAFHQLLATIQELDLGNTTLRNSNTSLLLRLVGVGV